MQQIKRQHIQDLELRLKTNEIQENIMESIYKKTVDTYLHKCTTNGYIDKILPISYKHNFIKGLDKEQIYIIIKIKCKIDLIKPVYNACLNVRIKEINKSCIIATNDPIKCIIIGLDPFLFKYDDEITVKIIETQIIKQDNTIRCTCKYIKHL